EAAKARSLSAFLPLRTGIFIPQGAATRETEREIGHHQRNEGNHKKGAGLRGGCVSPDRTGHSQADRNEIMSTSTLLLIIVLVLLIFALPTWPYSRGWGYYPSGGLGLILIILLVLLLLGVF